MQISGYNELFGMRESEESERVRRLRLDMEEDTSSSFWKGRGTDRVSISDEARRLNEEAQAKNALNASLQSSAQAGGASPAEGSELAASAGSAASISSTSSAAAEGGAKAGGSGSGSGDSSSKKGDIEKQIEKLQMQIANVMSSDSPPEAKQAIVQSLEAQISELSKQLAEIMSEETAG